MAKYQLAVETDNSRLLAIFPIERERRSAIDLTPIEAAQKRAIVRVFAVSGQERVELTSFDVAPLPRVQGRKVRLRLQARVDSDKRIRIALYVENRLFARREVPGRRYLGGPSPLGISAAVLLFLLLGAAVAYLAVMRAGDQPEGAAPGTPEEDAEERAAPGTADEDAARAGAGEPKSSGDSARSGEDTGSGEAASAGTAEIGSDERDPATASEAEPDAALSALQWTVYFRPDSAELTAETAGTLREVAGSLEEADSLTLELVGHTALFGTERGRVELSRLRAEAVAAFLRSRVADEAVALETSGVGGRSPVTEERDRQQLNRRVEISVVDQRE